MTLRNVFQFLVGFLLAVFCAGLADLIAVSYRIHRSGGVVSDPLSLSKAGLIVGVLVPIIAAPWWWKRRRFAVLGALLFAAFAASMLLAGM